MQNNILNVFYLLCDNMIKLFFCLLHMCKNAMHLYAVNKKRMNESMGKKVLKYDSEHALCVQK